jgi:hypothetical protein
MQILSLNIYSNLGPLGRILNSIDILSSSNIMQQRIDLAKFSIILL